MDFSWWRIFRSSIRPEGVRMKPRACCLFFLILIAPSLSPGQENLPALIKRVEPSIVSIVIMHRDGSFAGQGSGFFINAAGDVITSRHVLEGANRALLVTSEGKKYAILSVLDEDSEGDVIRVSTDLERDKVRPLPISSTFPEAGERVLVIGSPLGLEKTVSDGIVSAVREVPGFGKIIQITAPISPGSSGSPVVNMRGEVVGIATFFVVAGQNLNFAIPAERISKLVRGKKESLSEREERRSEVARLSVEFLYATGLRYVWVEEYEKALPHFLEVIKQNPDHAEVNFQAGYCLAKLGKYPQAIEFYLQTLRIKPNDADAHNNLCAAYERIEKYPEAIASCREASRLKPDLAEPYNNMAWCFLRMRRYQEAIVASKEAIRLRPDLATAHYNLGNAYAGVQQYREALESYKQAIRIRFDYAEAHLNLGAAYNQLGRYEEAMESYRQAIRLKPDLAEAHLNLGMTYLKTGDRGSALQEYRRLANGHRQKIVDVSKRRYQ
jgi:tetratricopeptide (TPR) repeat protein